MQQISFTGRFLKLTLIGYMFSIMSVAAAIWFASAPALHQMQQDAKRAHLETKASVIASILDNLLNDGEFIARSTEIISYLKGSDSRPGQAQSALLRLPDATNVRLIDTSGQVILAARQDGSSSPFLPVEALEGMAAMLEGRAPAAPRISYRPTGNTYEAQFLITIPILSHGLVEGLLAFERRLDLTHVLRAGADAPQTIIATTFQNSFWEEWHGGAGPSVSTPMPGADFHLIVDTDAQEIQTVGRTLVLTGIGVALLALILPFSLMAASGMRAIVRPHQELERSRRVLAIQQDELAELAQIAELARESISVTDSSERIQWVNQAFTKLTGYSQEEAVGKTPKELLHGPNTDPQTRQVIRRALEAGRPVQAEILNYRKDGTTYWISLGISPLDTSKKSGRRFAAIATDITSAKEAQAKLAEAKAATERQSLQDALTGLPNRRFLDDILETEVTNADPPRTLIRIDLDHFKNVNDTLGHSAGDYVLQQVGTILRMGIRPGDVAVRVGGDEFVILLARGSASSDATQLSERLLARIREEMNFEGKICRVGASFGVASAIGGLIENSDLLKSADSALYTAKELGRNTTTVYTPQLHSIVNEKRLLSAEIEIGLKGREFQPFFQPQFDARTEELVGIEALARWHHPTRGLLVPSQFLRVANQLRLTPEIDRQIFRSGLEAVRKLNAEDLFIPKIAFNMDVHQIANTRIEDIAEAYDIGDTRIAVEVLESVLVEEQDGNFVDRIDSLRRQGFQIEVDDFGSGHASVIGLKHLHPHVMKLDRMLVQPVDTDPTARALVRNMIEMGKALGISVTAEGVETAEHAAIMADLGCDTLQGFYFARPMDFEELRTFAQAACGMRSGQVASFTAHREKRRETR
ncbi:bifunctional diguanylate cyclase/phosphodiesterase [Roseobacter sinensis]|uniref:EAL domain-containing protein n=1 Tax=Roseobacter sinensis TaxID=2931391 RepID=A0ABT3BGW6_9RHOB|nr:EAL domain-containing protein [Roseobacter sp. WL0113]MCV3272824.1 EAL domain-containing protein [Roseobacter sp. WL0113]